MQSNILRPLKHQLFVMMLMMTLQWVKFFYWLYSLPNYQWIVTTVRQPIWAYYYGGPTFGTALSPYGVTWYIFYRTLSTFGFYPMVLMLIIIDTLIFIRMRNQPSYFLIVASISSFIFLALNPVDMLAFWFGVKAKTNWKFSILAIVTKLPVGSEIYFQNFHVWAYIWNTSLNSGGIPILSIWRYTLLGLWMINPLLYRGWYYFKPLKEIRYG